MAVALKCLVFNSLTLSIPFYKGGINITISLIISLLSATGRLNNHNLLALEKVLSD